MKPHADEWIEVIRSLERCEWCGEPERMPRTGLCKHCNRVRLEVARLTKAAEEEKASGNAHTFLAEYALAIVEEKKRSCQQDGKSLKYLLDGVDSLSLENWFVWVAKRIVKGTKLHYGLATELGWTFTASQRQVIAYLLWEIWHADERRNRWQGAAAKGYDFRARDER